ncbi:MAG TPA: hypothetical protein EYQ61_07320 [Dehalococcoidia bacterium]|jgi:hypothetical protein|nr:hypothetical protein [Dehalococcoidia bacterium]HIK89504.1 hypothetical protein [Dehalococcoidia bacterium]
MNLREVGRIAGILGAALAFFVGIISVVLGLTSTTSDQGGGSLVVRGLIVIGLSVIAGHGASLSFKKPERAAVELLAVAVLGSIVTYRSFLLAAVVLVVAAVLVYTERERDRE